MTIRSVDAMSSRSPLVVHHVCTFGKTEVSVA
jgi:hypothetical protein